MRNDNLLFFCSMLSKTIDDKVGIVVLYKKLVEMYINICGFSICFFMFRTLQANFFRKNVQKSHSLRKSKLLVHFLISIEHLYSKDYLFIL